MRLRLRVVPRASRAEVVGWLQPGLLKVKVTAPPEGGRANQEVVALLAKELGLSRRDVRLEAGAKAREKIVLCTGLSPEELGRRLPRGPA